MFNLLIIVLTQINGSLVTLS